MRDRRFGMPWEAIMSTTNSTTLTLHLLPQQSGFGYYPYSPLHRQYATQKTVQTIVEVARSFRFNEPGVVLLGVGDISFAKGGLMHPHHTHQHGTNADLRPLRSDGKPIPVTIHDPSYSRARTAILVASLLAHHNVKRILFNDSSIRGVHPFAGHDNHLHVEMRG